MSTPSAPQVMNGHLTPAATLAVKERGKALLSRPTLNKDTAFSREERRLLGLDGLLPASILTLEEQVAVELVKIRRKQDPLERYIGLAALQDRNETLFYRLLVENVEEFLPIVYTPTVGEACKRWSQIWRRARGAWITPEDASRIPELLRNASGGAEIRLIVVTDNERILGLGDLGVGGMGIPIGKLSLYTAAAGIQPSWALPVSLADPNYLGRRTPRLRGAEYDAFVESFVHGVQAAFPGCVIQWEDFKQQNAIRILERYRNTVPSFNDDIQGTGAVALAGIIAAIVAGGGSGTKKIEDQRILFYGAGAATLGIARLLRHTLAAAGLQGVALDTAIIALDSKGVVHEGRAELGDGKSELALSAAAVSALGIGELLSAELADVINQVQPTILIGTSGQAGAFAEPAIRAMASAAAAPLIWPLSNPTSCAEATPSDIFTWSDGRAVVATGSPFDPVVVGGTSRTISQANNVYIFPGVGLAAIAGRLKSIPDEAFIVAATTLAALTAQSAPAGGALYPPLADLRSISRSIAIAVIEAGAAAGWASAADGARAADLVDGAMWSPNYRAYVPA
jgi:malate dehydrogenase (oxaloacetate-decarboxylating)